MKVNIFLIRWCFSQGYNKRDIEQIRHYEMAFKSEVLFESKLEKSLHLQAELKADIHFSIGVSLRLCL